MCSRGNVQSGKYPLGEISGRGNVQPEKCPVGEIVTRANVWSGKCQAGELLVGELSSRRCVSRGSVGRGNVQSGKCRDPSLKFSLPNPCSNLKKSMLNFSFFYIKYLHKT